MSVYIKLSTMEYPRHIGDIEIDPVGMADYAPVVQYPPPNIDYSRNTLEVDTPQNREGVWHHMWKIVPYPDEVGAKRVREKRNQLLSESDWTQLDDTPLTNDKKLEWAEYRQALRDVPTQSGFPWEVVWPDKP